MPRVRVPFRRDQADSLRGRAVRLVTAFGLWPAQTTGTVHEKHPLYNGWLVEVRWNHFGRAPMFDFEYFSQDEFDEYLVEC